MKKGGFPVADVLAPEITQVSNKLKPLYTTNDLFPETLDTPHLKGHSYVQKPFLKHFRLEKGLSQRKLAEKIGIPRSNLQRLEDIPTERLPLGILGQIAKAFGLGISELLHSFDGVIKENLTRSHLKSPCFSFSTSEGMRIHSFLKAPDSCFIGSITIDPGKIVPKKEVPLGKMLFYLVLKGKLLLTSLSKETLFNEGECFSLIDPDLYELYNPQPLEKTISMLVCLPSFIRYPQE